MAEIRPFTDTDFSILLEGIVKDDGRRPAFGFGSGDKKPSLVGMFLAKDGGKFSQPMLSYFSMLSLAGTIDVVANYPGTDKIARTVPIMRGSAQGDVPTGTTVIISRRADGLITLRLENKDIRDAIFPININKGTPTETRVESGEPWDRRFDYQQSALEYANYMRARAYAWIDSKSAAGKEALRDKMNGSSSWG